MMPMSVEMTIATALAAIDLQILANCILVGETSRVAAVEIFREAHPIDL